MKFICLIICSLFFVACSKQEKKNIDSENQSSTQDSGKGNISGPQNEVLKKWVGKYEFDEGVEGVTEGTAQSWHYSVNVYFKSDSILIALIEIDGFQTMTRLEADVKADEKRAEFFFSKYVKDNMFEIYKNSDRLFELEINEKSEIITNWDKVKPNVISNRKNGKVMFQKSVS
ncbi:MAG: DUF5991 domain-containing protein [Chlorobi bacterium]|nr:DUF5991 domain-containing protein [Chlorobiota bacterium]MCI0716661.1 DUF5991 domain-containing protein [Chlorobiota bacterium]